MKLILIRHGETEWVRQCRYQGCTDVPLNRRGRSQARAIVRGIKKERLLAVYSSELRRAQETANLIARVVGKEPIIDRRLNEISFGAWEGKSYEEIRVQFPKASSRWYRAPWLSTPPGGESLRSLGRRVRDFLNELLIQHTRSHGTCVVVTHGGPIRMFLIRALKVPPKIFWTLRVDPASLSIIEVGSTHSELLLLNGQAHLNGLKST